MSTSHKSNNHSLHNTQLRYPHIFDDEFIALVPAMMQQYLQIKKQHQDKLVLFRMGDFYEFFYDDALKVARTLNLAISNRNKNKDEPMAGFPHHAAEVYTVKLLEAGFSLVICEQIGDVPSAGKGIAKREVVQILTPGTLIQDGFLPSNQEKPLVAIANNLFSYSLVIMDLASGRFEFGEYHSLPEFTARLEQCNPAEIIYLDSNRIVNQLVHLTDVQLTPLDSKYFQESAGTRKVKEFKLVANNITIELDLTYQAINALFEYVKHTQNKYPLHIQKLSSIAADQTMILDHVAINNLEILSSVQGSKSFSLFNTINHCVTALGSRQLQRDLLRPLINQELIKQRHNLIESLLPVKTRHQVSTILKQVSDIERIIARIGLSLATPADLTNLRNSMNIIDLLNEAIDKYQISCKSFVLPLQAWDLLVANLIDLPARKLGDGQIFKSGINQELDYLYNLTVHTQEFIQELEEKERTLTNIDNLKIETNNLLGYYIQVPLNSVVPDHYVLQKSLKSAIRYTTPDLLKLDRELTSAQFQINALESELFSQLIIALQETIGELQSFAFDIARLDVGLSHATLAFNYNYTCPTFNSEKRLNITQGRHPVIEQINSTPFIANNCQLEQQSTLQLITGPNMGGKSTYMRQTALICLLAQAGSFVPAIAADLPLLDRIFTRIGASDDLSQGKSTFMVEMSELSIILNQATDRSLLIIDEIGRGTSTYDGLSLAWASLEYISHSIKSLTLCATHYFELTQLKLDNIINVHLEAFEDRGNIRFSYQIMDGPASKSYGIAVANLAGLPSQVTKLAQHHLANLEAQQDQGNSHVNLAQNSQDLYQELLIKQEDQLSSGQKQLLEQIALINPDEISPKEAHSLLYKLVSYLKD